MSDESKLLRESDSRSTDRPYPRTLPCLPLSDETGRSASFHTQQRALSLELINFKSPTHSLQKVAVLLLGVTICRGQTRPDCSSPGYSESIQHLTHSDSNHTVYSAYPLRILAIGPRALLYLKQLTPSLVHSAQKQPYTPV